MKQYNYIYESVNSFEAFLDKKEIVTESKNVLIQIFSSLTEIAKIERIVSEITSAMPHANVIGTSTAGEIMNGIMYEESTVLSISVFEKTTIKTFFAIEPNSYKLGVKLANTAFTQEGKCVITFLDGLLHNGQEYLNGLSSMNYNHAVIAGGMAGDGLAFEKTYTICGNKVFSGGAVGASLMGEALEVYEDYNLGWQAVGPFFTITKSDGARVYEVDNRPIKDVYEEVLGTIAVENMPASTIEFPLIKEENDMLIARSMLHVNEDGSILYGGNLEEGEELRFGIGSRRLINQYTSKEAIKELEDDAMQACFIYSCLARKQFLGKELQKSFRTIDTLAPSAGFFTYGEFFFKQKQSNLLNVTTTLLFLREEGTTKIEKGTKRVTSRKESSKTDSALFNLIEYVTTELQTQEKIFRASKFKLDEFLKALDSVVIISRIDREGRLTYVNERFAEISGYSKKELIGASYTIMRDPTMDDKIFTQIFAELEKGNIYKGEFSNIAKDGSRYYVKSSIIPIHNEAQEISEYMVICEDVTSLVESKKKAEEAEKAQAMFLANMSHEIRTPMNGILGFYELLSKTKLNATQQKYLNIIGSSTKVLLDIVNDILDSSKITSKKIMLEKLPMNPYEEFQTTYELLRSIADEKSLKYKMEMDEDIAKCLIGDAVRLRQIKTNLLSNAIKFTPRFGEVIFRISLLKTISKKQIIEFSVTDSGIGIPNEKLKTIFEPFSQADASTTRKFGGTGLGLSISADLIKAFGSELKVDSKVGQGSRFYFEIPFDICTEEQEIATESEVSICINDEECDKFHLRVLVAEDYDINRMLMESLFEKYKNIELSFAVNGADAIEKVQHKPYDLIFMDINMPVKNGIDATRYIREKLHMDVPIVALTANAIEGDKERYFACGMDEYLTKPIELQALQSLLVKYAKTEDDVSSEEVEAIVKRINEKIGASQTMAKKLLKTFTQSLQELLPELQEALSIKDYKKVYETAHKLKGASSALYIDTISEVMAAIEKSAYEEKLLDYSQEIAMVDRYILKFKSVLDKIS